MMEIVIVTCVILAATLVVLSGVWVALVLIAAVMRLGRPTTPVADSAPDANPTRNSPPTSQP